MDTNHEASLEIEAGLCGGHHVLGELVDQVLVDGLSSHGLGSSFERHPRLEHPLRSSSSLQDIVGRGPALQCVEPRRRPTSGASREELG